MNRIQVPVLGKTVEGSVAKSEIRGDACVKRAKGRRA